MRRPWPWLVLWGSYLALSAALLWGWSYGLPSGPGACSSAVCVAVPYLAPALLTASAAGSALLGGALWARGARAPARPATAREGSLATVVLAVGVVMVALGGAVGRWMAWIGIGVAVAGAVGLVRPPRNRERAG